MALIVDATYFCFPVTANCSQSPCVIFLIFLSVLMLRRAPVTQRPGDPALTSATSGGYGITSAPFKPPAALASKRILALPARKRKAVSYKGQGAGDDSDSDAEAIPSKKGKFAMGNKEYGEDGVLGDMGRWCNRKFPVFKPKEKITVFTKRYRSPHELRLTMQLQYPCHNQSEDRRSHHAFPLPCLARHSTTSHPRTPTTARPDGGPCDRLV